jgi:hypothetical protein
MLRYMMPRAIFTVIEPDGKRQEIPLKSALIGGFMGDGSNVPMGAYVGELNLIDMGVVLQHVFRAFIKISNEHKMTEDQITSFFEFELKEAIRIEKKQDSLNNIDYDTHVYMRKYGKKFN